MKNLLLVLSSVCLIPTNAVLMIACTADKTSQTVHSDINDFLLGSNESNKLVIDKSDINKLESFGITYQDGNYQFNSNNLTVDAIEQGIILLKNNSSNLPFIFNTKESLLEVQAAENETALLVETQDCDISQNNLVYKWDISFYVTKFKNDEFEWTKTTDKSVELYVEIVDYQQLALDKLNQKTLTMQQTINNFKYTVDLKSANINNINALKDNVLANSQLKSVVGEIDLESIAFLDSNNAVLEWNKAVESENYQCAVNFHLSESKLISSSLKAIFNIKVIHEVINNKEKNQQIAKRYKEVIANWNEDVLMLLDNKISNTVEDLIYEVKNNDIFYSDNIEEQVIENSLIKVKNVNTQKYLQDSSLLSAEKFTVEIEFKIGEGTDQVTETSAFDIKIKDYTIVNNASDPTADFVDPELEEVEAPNEDVSNPKVTTTDDDTNVSSTTEEENEILKKLIIVAKEKTMFEQIIEKIKAEKSLPLETNITLKDSKNRKMKKNSEIKFGSYQVYADKTLILELQLEELILVAGSEQMTESEKNVFHIFDNIQLSKLMAQHCLVKNLKDMIKATDQFKEFNSKIKNNKILEFKVKDQQMNEVEDKDILLRGKYHIELLDILKDSNTKARITFEIDVLDLSIELSSQINEYVDKIKNTTVKIHTAKESTEDKPKCEAKIRDSKEIKAIFNDDKKIVVEAVEILEQIPYVKGKTYQARLTFSYKEYENASRRQVEFSFLVE